MPVYVYQGLESGQTFSLEQRIVDAALTHHPESGEPVKRLIGKPAIAFKGSGFYANDSKGGSSQSAKTESGGEAKAEPSGESKPATGGESKPVSGGEAKTETKPAAPVVNG
jgi:putative FmdB family regulatory protein